MCHGPGADILADGRRIRCRSSCKNFRIRKLFFNFRGTIIVEHAMNCADHPDMPAVAQCVDCGRGLCYACCRRQPPLCNCCARRRRSRVIAGHVGFLAVCAVLFVLGCRWNFMAVASEGGVYALWESGYVLTALFTGYIFIKKFLPSIPDTSKEEASETGILS